jgi:hypothetical protein
MKKTPAAAVTEAIMAMGITTLATGKPFPESWDSGGTAGVHDSLSHDVLVRTGMGLPGAGRYWLRSLERIDLGLVSILADGKMKMIKSW